MSRLLIDLNRSARHPARFSEFSRELSVQQRQELETARDRHEAAVAALVKRTKGPVLHLAVHTFTPRLGKTIRNFDVGVLYDPARKGERVWAETFQKALQLDSGLKVRRNAPYRGVADGLPTTLRRAFGPNKYLGIELEVNQKLVWPRAPAALLRQLYAAMPYR